MKYVIFWHLVIIEQSIRVVKMHKNVNIITENKNI